MTEAEIAGRAGSDDPVGGPWIEAHVVIEFILHCGAHTLHPLSPDMPGCIEMYSACHDTPSGPECTGAPFELACGESGRVPTGGDLLFCACP